MADTTPKKRCTRCKKVRDTTQFGINRRSKDGLNYWCKPCKSKARRREYLRVLQERRCGVQLEFELDVKVCPRCKTAKLHSHFGANRNSKSGLTAYCKPCSSIITAELWVRNSDAYETRKASNLRWRAANLRRSAEAVTRRNARLRAATVVPFTKEQLYAKWAYWGDKCWVCGGSATATDHVKPISKGGAHILCNLRPICKPCNSRKSGRWPFDLEWLRQFV